MTGLGEMEGFGIVVGLGDKRGFGIVSDFNDLLILVENRKEIPTFLPC